MSRIHLRGVGPQTSLAIVALGALLCAQAPDNPQPQTPTFRSTAELTVVDAVVTDGDGKYVTDLTADDFELYENGDRQVLQQVVYVEAGRRAAPRPLASSRVPFAGAAAATPAAPVSRFAGAAALRPDEVTRTIALVIDDLGLSFESTVWVRNAVHKYIDTQIADGDLVAIIRTSGGAGALQQFTTDRRLLHMAADRIQWTPVSRKVTPFEAVMPATMAGSTTITTPLSNETDDSIEGLRESMLATGSMGAIEFIVRGTQELPGRKSLILFSEGLDIFNRAGSERTRSAMSRMLAHANRAGVVVYTVDPRGLQTGGLTAEDDPTIHDAGFGSSPAGIQSAFRERIVNSQRDRRRELLDTQESLAFIAAQTGGFSVANTNDLNRGIQRVLDDQRGYYLLGYVSKTSRPRKWEQGQISVKVKRNGLHVRARAGVYGPSSPNEPEEPLGEPLLLAALSPFAAGDITVRLTSLFSYEKTAGSSIRSMLFIDANALTFETDDQGRHETHPEIVFVSIGDNGQINGHWKQTFDLAFTDEEYTRARQAGLVYHTRIPVKDAGAYQVRAAVRDPSSGRMGSASQFLEVPRVGEGRLAVSGVLLREKEAKAAADALRTLHADTVLGAPTLRIYHPGSDVIYAYEVYDGLSPEARDALAMSTALVRDGKVLYESPPSPIKAPAHTDKLRVIPIGGLLSLGDDVPPGQYSLEVRVTRRDKQRALAQQWTDFEVQKP